MLNHSLFLKNRSATCLWCTACSYLICWVFICLRMPVWLATPSLVTELEKRFWAAVIEICSQQGSKEPLSAPKPGTRPAGLCKWFWSVKATFKNNFRVKHFLRTLTLTLWTWPWPCDLGWLQQRHGVSQTHFVYSSSLSMNNQLWLLKFEVHVIKQLLWTDLDVIKLEITLA